MSVYQKVIAYKGTIANPVPPPPADGWGAIEITQRAMVRVKADGTVESAMPPVGSLGPILSITRNGAGDYTVALVNTESWTAAQLAPQLTIMTAALVGQAVVTDATTIAVTIATDAGVATDAIFSLALHVLKA